MILGTAGHIDHGKTTLVRALTGVDTALSRAMTELIATDLNGAGVLRAVVPSAVSAAVRATIGHPASTPDRPVIRAVAQRLGAGLLVTGEVSTSANGARVTLALRDARDQLAAGNTSVALSMLNAALSDIDAATDVVTPSSRPTST